MLDCYQRILLTPPEEFANLVREGVMRDPFTALSGLREVAVTLSEPIKRPIPKEAALTCLDHFSFAIGKLRPLIDKHFIGREDVHWQFGRTLDRLGLPDQALPYINYVCKIADEQTLRAKAFARAAEINLTLHDRSLSKDFAGAAFESASMADCVEEGSDYTTALLSRAYRTLHESWRTEYGFVFPAVGNH